MGTKGKVALQLKVMASVDAVIRSVRHTLGLRVWSVRYTVGLNVVTLL